MVARHGIVIVSGLALVLFGCKKDEEEETPAPITPPPGVAITDFSPLDSGNYWIYERARYDSLGGLDAGPWVDSLWVEGDTVLADGYSYTVLRRALNGNPIAQREYQRIEGNAIWAPGRELLFQVGTYDQVVYVDTIGSISITYSVPSQTEQVSTQAGDLLCYRLQGDVQIIQGSYPPVPAERQPYYLWSPGVGRVALQEPFVSQPLLMREVLLRYHVQ